MSELLASDVREAIAGTLAPLREHLARLDDEIERRARELAALKDTRTDLNRIIRTADPTAPKPGIKSGTVLGPRTLETPRSHRNRVSRERLDALTEYLRAHLAEGDEITRKDLLNRPDFKSVGISEGSLGYALLTLVDEGALRLDRIGRKGGARVYKLTRNASDGQ